MKVTKEKISENITKTGQIYRWIIEMPIWVGFGLLVEAWKLLALSTVVVELFLITINKLASNSNMNILKALEICSVIFLIIIVLSIPVFYWLIKTNNKRFTVLYEMDENGIDQTQIKINKKIALQVLADTPWTISAITAMERARVIDSPGISIYSLFLKVTNIKGIRKKGLIKVSILFFTNRIYVEQTDFDYVYNYLTEHCPYAYRKIID